MSRDSSDAETVHPWLTIRQMRWVVYLLVLAAAIVGAAAHAKAGWPGVAVTLTVAVLGYITADVYDRYFGRPRYVE